MVHSKRSSLFVLAALVGSSMAIPMKREVPQEHSHNPYLATTRTFLNKNNPDGILDPVFGLLGNAAAAGGLGKIKDVACLQQATADRAFTNAKAAGSVDGQVGALVYRALERNTPGVGVASAPCTSIKAVNKEIAAVAQHQDPASPNAAAINKAIVLALAKQIQAVGGNPLTALDSGTFKPGNVKDNTGKGNTCDTENDLAGCIFSQHLLVDDATPAEISAAVGGGAAPKATASKPAASAVAAAAPTAAAGSGTLNFGKCTNPSMSFGFGFPGRKATEQSFEPTDLAQFNHDTALNPNIIMQFICDNLVNNCGLNNANASVIACRAAQVKADANGEHGVTADVFNGLLGFKTNFAAVEAAGPAGGAATAASSTAAAAAPASTAAAAAPASTAAAAGSGKLSFGKCTNPSMSFGFGFPGRKATEASFEPTDLAQFNHGTALNPNIIMQFICDNLVNSCGLTNADATVIACRAAQTKADANGEHGVTADVFNGLLGFKTNFAAVEAAGPAGGAATAASSTAAAAAPASSAAASSGKLSFGTCTDPTIKFGAGLDGRQATEFSFINNNQQQFPHGSALNIKVVADFTCTQFVNGCGLKNGDPAIAACQAASTAAQALGKVGAAADSFNKALGFTTDFAAVKTT